MLSANCRISQGREMTSNVAPFKHGEVEPAETIRMLRKFNVITILQTLVMFFLFIGPSDAFLRPTTPPDPWWISLAFGPRFEVWDVLFPLAALTLIHSTVRLRRMTLSHSFTAAVWGALGFLWLAGSQIGDAPGYLFGAGLFAFFIASQHIAILNIWRAEGVG